MLLEIIDPTQYPGWDELLLSTPGSSFFHSSAWARVLAESYGYKPFYFSEPGDGRFRILIPVMEVDSLLTGKRGVSLPFTDYCQPLMDEDLSFHDLFNQIVEFGRKRGWKYIEMRGGEKYLNPSPSTPVPRPPSLATDPSSLVSFCTYLGHTLDLTVGEEKLFSGFRDSTRRNIKKAAAQGVKVSISNDLEGIREFYRLNRMTRKTHGLPPQPLSFFLKVYAYVIFKGLGFVALASHEGGNIAGAVFFHFGDRGVYKYGASNRKYQELRANNLVMWEGIRRIRQNGFKSLCFGRTEEDNQGLIQFKSGWGTKEQEIRYHRYDLEKGAFVSGSSKITGFHNEILKRMPVSILTPIGNLLYKHAG